MSDMAANHDSEAGRDSTSRLIPAVERNGNTTRDSEEEGDTQTSPASDADIGTSVHPRSSQDPYLRLFQSIPQPDVGRSSESTTRRTSLVSGDANADRDLGVDSNPPIPPVSNVDMHRVSQPITLLPAAPQRNAHRT
jgi:hypothetical protein